MEQLSTTHHPRESSLGQWIYPVISRRAGGLSLGLNLNLDKNCSFACPYCQVDRRIPSPADPPPALGLLKELDQFLQDYEAQGQYQGHQLKDISIAGDGEPTLYKELPQLLEGLIKRRSLSESSYKMVLFTNGTHLNRADLSPLWPQYFAQQGEVWFKLDFWDQHSFERANGKRTEHQAILTRLLSFGRSHPVTLQTCFFRHQDEPVNLDFADLWSDQLLGLLAQGLQVREIQVYTLARKPTDPRLVPYDDSTMDRVGQQIRALTDQPVEIFYSH